MTDNSVSDQERQQKVRVNWCAVTPMPYFEDFFKKASNSQLFDLQVFYLHMQSTAHPLKDETGIGYKFRAVSSWRGFASMLWSAISIRDRCWLVGGWGAPKYMTLLVVLIMFGRRFWLFTDTPKPSGRSRRWSVRLLRPIFLRLIFSNAIQVIGTGALAASHLTQMGVPKQKIVSLPYPLDERRFGVIERNSDHEQIVVVFSGRLHLTDKRFDIAVECFRNALRVFEDQCELTLKFAGTGPDADQLRLCVEAAGLTDRVEILGWLSQPELLALYQSADIYIHPADFEPYGVTLVEALYCGMYVVSSDQVGAAVELIKDGVNGTLFRAGDVQAAKDALVATVRRFLTARPSKLEILSSSLKWRMEAFTTTAFRIFSEKAV